MKFTQARTTTLVAAVAGCLALVLSAFTPSPQPSSPSGSESKLSADVREWADSLPNSKQPPGPKCTTGQDEKGQKTQLCLEKVDPKTAPPLPPMPRTADPVPPQMCYDKPGQVNYDRFHACQQSTVKIILRKGPLELEGYVWWGVWETLSAKNRSWKMQFGIRPYNWAPDLLDADPKAAVATQCTQHCDTPDPEQKAIESNNQYIYYGEQDVSSPGSAISYSNPWTGLRLDFDPTEIDPYYVSWDELTTPFNIRCDSESYIGSNGGCVHYLGYDAIPIYYLDYTGPYAEVAKNALYGMTVGDPVNHYGNIQYGNPLTRGDMDEIDPHRDSICTSSIKAKASALGLSCDEYPYAASEQGGSGNPRFSCAFVPGPQNTNQGSDMNNHFFIPNRILPAINETGHTPGDAFWVWVTNAPANPPPVKQCSTY